MGINISPTVGNNGELLNNAGALLAAPPPPDAQDAIISGTTGSDSAINAPTEIANGGNAGFNFDGLGEPGQGFVDSLPDLSSALGIPAAVVAAIMTGIREAVDERLHNPKNAWWDNLAKGAGRSLGLSAAVLGGYAAISSAEGLNKIPLVNHIVPDAVAGIGNVIPDWLPAAGPLAVGASYWLLNRKRADIYRDTTLGTANATTVQRGIHGAVAGILANSAAALLIPVGGTLVPLGIGLGTGYLATRYSDRIDQFFARPAIRNILDKLHLSTRSAPAIAGIAIATTTLINGLLNGDITNLWEYGKEAITTLSSGDLSSLSAGIHQAVNSLLWGGITYAGIRSFLPTQRWEEDYNPENIENRMTPEERRAFTNFYGIITFLKSTAPDEQKAPIIEQMKRRVPGFSEEKVLQTSSTPQEFVANLLKVLGKGRFVQHTDKTQARNITIPHPAELRDAIIAFGGASQISEAPIDDLVRDWRNYPEIVTAIVNDENVKPLVLDQIDDARKINIIANARTEQISGALLTADRTLLLRTFIIRFRGINDQAQQRSINTAGPTALWTTFTLQEKEAFIREINTTPGLLDEIITASTIDFAPLVPSEPTQKLLLEQEIERSHSDVITAKAEAHALSKIKVPNTPSATDYRAVNEFLDAQQVATGTPVDWRGMAQQGLQIAANAKTLWRRR